MEDRKEQQAYILGLDIGVNSVGWAMVAVAGGKPVSLLGTGVRIFSAGVEGDIESGKDQSRAVKRREARLRRRMLERHSRRLRKLAYLLQGAGLLPPGDLSSEEQRHKLFANLDNTIFSEPVRKQHPHVLPYLLRAQALDRKLPPYELGRALFHLAQRRGFLSNRNTPLKKDEDEGQIKKEIGDLAENISASGARTLGEYLSRLNTAEERIRGRWTARQMYIDEFEKIWTSQSEFHHNILTEDLKRRVLRTIFYQRPLKSARHLIGECELEPGRKRAPLAILDAQRFRLLQKINDLKVKGVDPETGEVMDERRFTDEERVRLAEMLETRGDCTFSQIRKLLGYPKWAQFNFEEGGEKRLVGNRTAAKLREIFGERWDTFSEEEKDRIVEDIRSIRKEEALTRRGIRAWDLGEEAARAFGQIALEPEYCSLSRQALARILPLMEQGMPYATARKTLYGDRHAPTPYNQLPPLAGAPIPELRNPSVARALTEVRKVVNAIVRKHGKPSAIRIELARDLKKSRKDRKEIWKRNQANRKAREEATRKLLTEAGIEAPLGRDIAKRLLADECGWICPYTGRAITSSALFGASPQFDVEHIIPFNRCLDDSSANKTLCYHEENRNVKRNRTPWEAYGSNPDRWDEIIQRIKRFQGSAARAKLERFLLTDLESFEDFTERQLADTRYATRLAIQYLGLLYGTGAEGVDADHTRCVQAGRGQITKYLGEEYGLYRILGGGREKTREDRRHHAVDAICISLTDARTVKALSDAAQRALSERRRRFGMINPPWPAFCNDVKTAIDGLIVSHRVSRKVSGPLHDETIYSKPQRDPEGRECVHVRKRIESLSKGDIENIVDSAVKKAVLAKLNGGDPKKVFADKAAHPQIKSGVPIHSVRIRKYETTLPISSGARARQVMSGSNHHIEIFEVRDKRGNPKWDGKVISTYEAMRRLRVGEPIIQRDHGDDKRFVCSLAGGEIIELNEDGQRELYVIRTISLMKQAGRQYVNLEFVHNNDARKKEDIKKAKQWYTSLLEPLRKLSCRKVLVTPIGEIRCAND